MTNDQTVQKVILGGTYVGKTEPIANGALYRGWHARSPDHHNGVGEFGTREEAEQAVREEAILRVFRANPNARVWLDVVEADDTATAPAADGTRGQS